VVKTLQHLKGVGLMEGQPKTARSRRSIALSPQAVNLLHAIRNQQVTDQLEAGPIWQDTGHGLTQPDGRPMNPIKVTQEFAAIIRKAGLPHLTFHGLRHAYPPIPGSWCIPKGGERVPGALQYRYHHGHLFSRDPRAPGSGSPAAGPAAISGGLEISGTFGLDQKKPLSQ
jgi:integrase